MKPSANTPAIANPMDADQAEQARPGFGIPSQDPRPEAQMPLQPAEARREAGSALAAGGVMAGAATGALIGVAVGGPVGVLVGIAVGAVAGALGAAAAGAAMNLDSSSDTGSRQRHHAAAAPDPATPDGLTVPISSQSAARCGRL